MATMNLYDDRRIPALAMYPVNALCGYLRDGHVMVLTHAGTGFPNVLYRIEKGCRSVMHHGSLHTEFEKRLLETPEGDYVTYRGKSMRKIPDVELQAMMPETVAFLIKPWQPWGGEYIIKGELPVIPQKMYDRSKRPK